MSGANSEYYDDRIDADAYSVEELQEVVFDGGGRLSRPLALALLGRKDYPGKVRDLERVLTNEQETPRLRAMAAHALGETGGRPALRALERGLGTQDGVTLRGVAKALAATGTRRHVRVLEGLAERSGPVGRDAERALAVLTKRVGARGRAAGREENGRLRVEPTEERAPVEVEAPRRRDVTQAIAGIRGRRLARASAVAFRCQGRELMFLFDEESLERGVGLVARQGEVGVVAERRQLEAVGWEERYRVLVEPGTRGAFELVVATHDGRSVLRGRGEVRGNEAVYELDATDEPGALPIHVRGRFDGRRVTVEEGVSALRRRPSPAPMPLRRP
jgi:hypothetical protein